MSDEIRKVAFVGLGRMGTGMALNILDAGFDLTVYNRTAAKMKPLIEKGAAGAGSPREAAEQADVVLTCLMDDQSVLDNVTGENGLLAGLKAGGIHIGATTNSPGLAKQLAELHAAAGSYYVAGPVTGRPDSAAAGTLLSYVAGSPEAVAQCTRLFDAYTSQITYVGEDHSIPNTLKLCGNFMVVSLIELMGEVYAFAEKGGVDLDLIENLIGVILHHPVFQEYAERIHNRRFDPAAFELKSGFKDVQLMLQASTAVRAPLSYASLIREKFLAALAQGMENRDWSAIYEITRANAGLVE